MFEIQISYLGLRYGNIANKRRWTIVKLLQTDCNLNSAYKILHFAEIFAKKCFSFANEELWYSEIHLQQLSTDEYYINKGANML